MRQFTLASILALTILGGVAVSSADAQYWRRGTYYYPRTTYYSRPYSNVYSNVLPSTVYSPGYLYSRFYNASPITTVPYYNNTYTSGYYSTPYYSNSYYYSTPYYGYRGLRLRR